VNRLNHVAVIADGNGRWAEQRGLERSLGHEQGLNKVEDMMHWCVDMGIPALGELESAQGGGGRALFHGEPVF